jgi:hypothetical protein
VFLSKVTVDPHNPDAKVEKLDTHEGCPPREVRYELWKRTDDAGRVADAVPELFLLERTGVPEMLPLSLRVHLLDTDAEPAIPLAEPNRPENFRAVWLAVAPLLDALHQDVLLLVSNPARRDRHPSHASPPTLF